MRILVWILMLIAPINGWTDIFAVDKDDGGFMTAYKTPYRYSEKGIHPMLSATLNRDAQIEMSIEQLSRRSVRRRIGDAPLLLWSYAAPAEADVYKYFQTIAYLRYAMDQKRLGDLESNDRQDLNALRKQSVFDCLRDKYFVRHEFRNDLAGLLDSCQGGSAFQYLQYSDGDNLFGNLFDAFNLRGERKERILAILPVWKITKTGLMMSGPAKRIGRVLKDHRQEARTMLEQAIDELKTKHMVDGELLNALSLPAKPFTEAEVLLLLSFDEKKLRNHIEDIVSGLSVYWTMDQYNEAIDWLGRYRDHPNIANSYKNIITKGINFLEGERKSFFEKAGATAEYGKTLGDITDSAHAEQRKMVEQNREQAGLWSTLGL